MKTVLKILIILLFIPTISYAQLEYHNWVYGDNIDLDPGENITGITFLTESGDPEYLNIGVSFDRDTSYYFRTDEGSACLSDTNGILRYQTVRNGILSFKNNTIESLKEDTVIIDGSKLDGSFGGSQYVSIASTGDKIVRIATSSIYQTQKDLTYVVISTEDGKLKISNKKVIKKDYGSESIAIIKEFDSNSFYLVANDKLEKLYYLYKYDIATESFIAKDTIESFMDVDVRNGKPILMGTIKVSPNGKFIVCTNADSYNGIEVLKFDSETEQLELIKTFNDNDSEGGYIRKYSGEFSPNSKHFYLIGSKSYMYAITNFRDSDNLYIKKVAYVDYNNNWSDHRTQFLLGPNERIYFSDNDGNSYDGGKDYISALENPNNINDIRFIRESVVLPNTSSNSSGPNFEGFPNIPTTYYFQVSIDIDSMEVCIGDEIFVETNTLNEPEVVEYIWTAPNRNKYETKNLKIDSATKDMTGIFELSVKSVGYNFKRQVYVKVNGPIVKIKTYKTSICVGDTNTIYIENPSIEKVTESILWSTGDTTRGTIIDAPGVYSVTVTDFEGCSVTESITIDLAKPEIDINPLLPTIFCEGDSTILEVTPYDNSNTYTWSNGELGKQIIVKTGGTYSVRVLEGENCRDTAYIEVKVNENLEPNITGTNFCSGEFATLEVLPNDPSYTYKWNNGEETPVIVVSQAGTYSVTVSKAGCVGTAKYTVKENPIPEFEILGESIICKDETATLSSNKDFDEYLWSTNEITKEIEVTEAGTYTLTVTDENGCMATKSFKVEKYELSFDISKGNIDFGKVYITENPKDSVIIVNTSGVDVVMDLESRIKLMNGQTFMFKKTLKPEILGIYSDSYSLHIIEPCDTVITIPITARVFARTTISTEDIYSLIGQTETVPVYLDCEADLPVQEYSITTDIDRTAFFTNDSYTVTQNQPISKARTNIHNLTGTILLSSALEYNITFPNYAFTNQYIEVIEQPGKIYIDSVCVFKYREIQLLDSTTLDISPNPANEQLNIDITTGAQGTMKLELVATDGRVIYTDEWIQSTKSKQMQINTIAIPSGQYQVRLITPYDAITKSVVVVE
ncbi:MAG: T9SS type A sorting domain-containing protein [Candidatus Kapaibacterium sp.]